MLRAFGHRVAMCCNMLGVVGSSLKLVKFEPATPNMSQHGGQTHATCCAQHCCDLLCWHVAIVWPGPKALDSAGTVRLASNPDWLRRYFAVIGCYVSHTSCEPFSELNENKTKKPTVFQNNKITDSNTCESFCRALWKLEIMTFTTHI